MIALGSQILADFYGCDRDILDDPVAISAILVEAAVRCGATIVDRCIHRFSPQGISGVIVIAESHLGIHTWPEHGYAAIDLFTCGSTLRTEACFLYLQEALRCQQYSAQTIARGPLDATGRKSAAPTSAPAK